MDWAATVISRNDLPDVPVRSGRTPAAPGTVGAANTLSPEVKPMSDPGISFGLVILPPSHPALAAQLVTVACNVTPDAPLPDLRRLRAMLTLVDGWRIYFAPSRTA